MQISALVAERIPEAAPVISCERGSGERHRVRALGQRHGTGWIHERPCPLVMQVIPAIDLLDGHCVRLHQGDYDRVTRFNDDPVAQALEWQRQGATRLHLVDLDGARSGTAGNDGAVQAIAAALSIPVQLGEACARRNGSSSFWAGVWTG